MNYNKTNITFTLIFYVIFQKLNMNKMDTDVNDLNEIDRKWKVEVSSDNDMQIIYKECSEVIEDIDKLKKNTQRIIMRSIVFLDFTCLVTENSYVSVRSVWL